jgi:hypothetical protein
VKALLKLPAVTAILIALTACGSSTKPGSVPDSTPSPSPTIIPNKVGQPFVYTYVYSDGSPSVDYEVTVTQIQCGITLIKLGLSNPAYTSGNWTSDKVPPERIDAAPKSGDQFCKVTATEKIVGKVPGADGGVDLDNLVMDIGEFQAGRDDEDISRNLNTDSPRMTPNPGATLTVIKVYTVPAAAKPVGVLFPIASVVRQTPHLVQL